MGLGDIARRLAKLTADNSPVILTAIGVVGTLTTAYLTGKASFKAAQILDDHETLVLQKEAEPLTTREKAQTVWKLYIPPASSAVCTIACIILANRIGGRRAAALAAAYAISERGFEEYRQKVAEKIGMTKEQKVRDEIAQDRVNRNPPPGNEVVLLGDGSVLCQDHFSGRYFLSDMETLKKAQNDINYTLINDYYASLTDFYQKVGLPSTGISDEFGWNANRLLELSFSTTLAPESNKPCLVVDFVVTPIRNFYRVG
jgi:hypothetical protein